MLFAFKRPLRDQPSSADSGRNIKKKPCLNSCVTACQILVHDGVCVGGLLISLNCVLDYCHMLDISQTENIKDETQMPFDVPRVNNSE